MLSVSAVFFIVNNNTNYITGTKLLSSIVGYADNWVSIISEAYDNEC